MDFMDYFCYTVCHMEFLKEILPYVQLALGFLVVVGVLLQQSDASIGSVFGGGNDAGGIAHTRRGAEKIIFNGTVVVSILFVFSVIFGLLA